tara:strand:+ start:483 stop:953 length:471 start_codon:yes stop_codon:yes gene_type:complete
MLILSDDILLLLWKYYIKNGVVCIKNGEAINNFFVCKKMYDIFKKNQKKIIQWDCKMLIISNINYKICSTHDNIGLEYVNKIVGQIEKYISLQEEPTNNGVIGINFHKFHVTNFIHCPDLKKNEIFVKRLLEKYNLKIVRYCCGGDGCELRQIKKN